MQSFSHVNHVNRQSGQANDMKIAIMPFKFISVYHIGNLSPTVNINSYVKSKAPKKPIKQELFVVCCRLI